jgi:chromosome segregation ATPase
LREEVATLTGYIANRRSWWDDLEARVAGQATRIAELERELVHRTERQQRADALAEREAARAQALREQLVGQARRAEALAAELTGLRADPAAVRATVATLETRLADAESAAAATRELLAETQAELAAASRALADQRTAQIHRDAQHTAALETIAQLEAKVAQERSTHAAERTTLREQSERLAATESKLEGTLRQLAETGTALDHVRGDAARIERAVVDKDRALEARDQRIAALQKELHQKLGALQKLNAMDLSLQGLDSKMSERLRRADTPVDQPNTPAFVCLSGDAPRQYALSKKTMTIGRSARCDIQILTHFVSREHARLTIARGTVVIEDLGSTNGIFVNSVRIDRQELRHGDLVTVGETQFRYLESMAH